MEWSLASIVSFCVDLVNLCSVVAVLSELFGPLTDVLPVVTLTVRFRLVLFCVSIHWSVHH
jgi:hypothetical protein